MKIHIIFCNDYAMHAVVDDEAKALKKKDEIKQHYFDLHPWLSEDERNCLYFHIHTVEGS